MKKIFGLITALAIPVASLPLVNAAPVNENVNLSDAVIKFGQSQTSTMTFRFKKNSKWGTYADLYKIRLTEDVDAITIPRDVTASDGQSYLVRTINTVKDEKGDYTVKLLDFSHATFLDDIGEYAFSKYIPDPKIDICEFTIKAIKWGAIALTGISLYSFACQSFDPEYGEETFNFGGTNLIGTGKYVFYNCCASHKNTFEKAIFPKNYKGGGESTFGGNSNERLKCKYIIFTSTDTKNMDFLSGGMPDLDTSVEGAQTVVPYGCLAKYKKVDGFDDTQAHQSTLYYDENHQGSLQLASHVNMEGKDNVEGKYWFPFNGTEVDVAATKHVVGGPWDDFFSVNTLGKLTWQSGAPVGQYKAQVYATKIDENNLLQFAIGEPITFNSVLANLTDVKSFYTAKSEEAGESEVWHSEFHSVPEVSQYSISYSIKDLPVQLEEKVTVKGGNDGQLVWQKGLTKGTYSFLIQPIVQIPEHPPFALPDVPITLVVTSEAITGQGFEMFVGNSQSATKYDPKTTIQLSVNEEMYIFANVDDDVQPTPWVKPNVSCSEAATQTGEEKTAPYGYKYKLNTSQAGTYRFCFYQIQKFDEEGTITLPIYSDWITVKVGNTAPTIADSDSYYQVPYSDQGTILRIPVSATDNVVVRDVAIAGTAWESDETKTHIQNYITVSRYESDKKMVNVAIATDFFEPLQNLRKTDLQLTISLGDTSNNEIWQCQKSFSLITTNSVSIDYSGSTILYAYEHESEKIYQDKFELLKNGQSIDPRITGLEFTARVDGEEEKYKDLVYMKNSESFNTAQLCVKDIEIPSDKEQLVLPVTITAKATGYDSATYAITLIIRNEFIFSNFPEQISAAKGRAGKWEQNQIKTLFNGVEQTGESVTYKITGYPNEGVVLLDEDGYINWTDQIRAGEFDITITATSQHFDKTFNVSQTFKLKVSGSNVNVGLIVGASVGGAVVAGGAATGITLGVKKHKAKPTKRH